MKRPNDTAPPTEWIAYSDYLEKSLNGTGDLIQALNRLNRTYADEIDKRISKGKLLEDVNFFKQSINLFAQIPKFREIYTPPVDEVAKKEKEAEKNNIFEATQRKLKEGNGG